MNFRTVVRTIAPAALLLLATGVIQAIPINGSLPLNGGGLTQNSTDLSLSTLISSTSVTNLSLGSGSYAFIPVLTNFGGATLDLNNLASFSFSSTVWGSFAATVNPSNQIVQRTANFLDVFIIGNFTPGTNPGWAGFDTTNSSLRFSINQSGSSISEAITLNSPALPPPGVPEPATMALLGIGLVGLGLFGRNRLVR
jgi:hypothetical protein